MLSKKNKPGSDVHSHSVLICSYCYPVNSCDCYISNNFLSFLVSRLVRNKSLPSWQVYNDVKIVFKKTSIVTGSKSDRATDAEIVFKVTFFCISVDYMLYSCQNFSDGLQWTFFLFFLASNFIKK